jgi:hypothetical protein
MQPLQPPAEAEEPDVQHDPGRLVLHRPAGLPPARGQAHRPESAQERENGQEVVPVIHLGRCWACGHFGWVKIKRSFVAHGEGPKWICVNRRACVRRQEERYG